MKNILILLMVLSLTSFCTVSNAQFWKKVANDITSNSKNISKEDAVAGIKEALIQGTTKSVSLVSAVDGYFGNPEIKIPFPPEAKSIEEKLRMIGLGGEVDKVILSINRAAEDAATEVKPIFISAIKNMSISDALDIVNGENHAATKYLQKKTTKEISIKIKPLIENSLDKVDATKYWDNIILSYNNIPFVKKQNPDLAEYVTEMAIEGMFVMIAKEEEKIRKDPLARTSEILELVFGD